MFKLSNEGKLALMGSVMLPLSLLVSQSAQAYDLKVYSGAMCQAFYGSQEARFNKQWDGIKNISGTASWVMCGIVRDNQQTIIGSNGFQAWVKAPGAAQTVCYHSERSRTTSVEVQTKALSRTGTGFLNLDTGLSQANGQRILACKLPPNGILSTIYYWEHDDTDDGA